MPPKQPLIRDRKYLNSYRDAACYACGAHDGTVVGAHIRAGFFGMGVKPDDSLTLPLCAKCHADQGAGEVAFWDNLYGHDGINRAKAAARRRYQLWSAEQ